MRRWRGRLRERGGEPIAMAGVSCVVWKRAPAGHGKQEGVKLGKEGAYSRAGRIRPNKSEVDAGRVLVTLP